MFLRENHEFRNKLNCILKIWGVIQVKTIDSGPSSCFYLGQFLIYVIIVLAVTVKDDRSAIEKEEGLPLFLHRIHPNRHKTFIY